MRIYNVGTNTQARMIKKATAKRARRSIPFCILLARATISLSLLDEWTFLRGEWGEILDECIEVPTKRHP